MEVQVRDVRLFFDVDGAKLRPVGSTVREVPTFVVVHDGPGADHTTFKYPVFARSLAATAQIVYFDLRGHGRSEESDASTWRLEVWADDVHALCEELGISSPIVFGSGFGALVATRYAARHPDHPLGLVLARPVARFDAARSVAVFERLAGPLGAEPVLEFYAQPNEATYGNFVVAFMRLFRSLTPAEIADALLRAEWSSLPAIDWYGGEAREFDLRPDAAAIRVPTLVLAGEDDPLMPVDGADDLVAAFDASRVEYHRFPDTRHSIYADQPLAMDLTVAFVRTLSEADAPAA